jgi:hypothetical protein
MAGPAKACAVSAIIIEASLRENRFAVFRIMS